jgi:hypothetical protein
VVTAAWAPLSLAAQIGERVLIRHGFVVPAGKLLLVDDMSVDCVIASEAFNEQEFHKVGVEATAILGIEYPLDARPNPLELRGGDCPSQDYVVGTRAARGRRAWSSSPASPTGAS